MRRASAVDANQPEIVEAIRKMGCSVQHLHTIGQGCPDLLIGISGKNILAEIKDGSKPPSSRKLTADEIIWHGLWRGQVQIIDSIEHAIRAINWWRKQ